MPDVLSHWGGLPEDFLQSDFQGNNHRSGDDELAPVRRAQMYFTDPQANKWIRNLEQHAGLPVRGTSGEPPKGCPRP